MAGLVSYKIGFKSEKVMRDKKGHYMQAYLGDIAGLVSHHHSIANISFKPAKLIFGFPVKKFCLYYIVVY